MTRKLSKTRIKIVETFDQIIYQPQYQRLFIWFDMRESALLKSTYGDIESAQKRIDRWIEAVNYLLDMDERDVKRKVSRKVRFVDYP